MRAEFHKFEGLFAKFYDPLINILTFGRYSKVIREVIQLLDIKPCDKILDMGAGTGRNAVLMAKYLSEEGRILGIDVSDDMVEQFRKRTEGLPNVQVEKRAADEELPYREEFDKVFISFLLHGLTREGRRAVLENAYKALKGRGQLFIFDYSQFDMARAPWYVRLFFAAVECQRAYEFIREDLGRMLGECGFVVEREHFFFAGYTKLVVARKGGDKLGEFSSPGGERAS